MRIDVVESVRMVNSIEGRFAIAAAATVAAPNFVAAHLLCGSRVIDALAWPTGTASGRILGR